MLCELYLNKNVHVINNAINYKGVLIVEILKCEKEKTIVSPKHLGIHY